MKFSIAVCLCLALSCYQVPVAFAQTILYQTSFELPVFTPGKPIRGQDGWEMFSDGASISISTNNANIGNQCLLFEGKLLEPQANGSSIGLAQLSPESLAELSGDPPPAFVEIQCDVRLDGPQVGTGGRPEFDKLSANLYAGGSSQYFGGFVVSSAGRIWSVSFAPGELYRYSVPYEFGTYRTLTIRVNYTARTLTYLVDGIELGSSPINPSNTDDRLSRADLLVAGPTDPIHDGKIDYEPSNYVAYYDNYRIRALPLPSAPEIEVQVGGESLNSGLSKVDFGAVTIGSGYQQTFTIRNLGKADLAGISVRIEGDGFSVAQPPGATIVAGEAAEISVWFRPVKSGEMSGTLLITSNDSDEGVFEVGLQGNGTELISQWPSNLGVTLKTNEYPSYLTCFRQGDGKLVINLGVEWYKDETFFQGGSRYWRVLRVNKNGSLDPSFSTIEYNRSTDWYGQRMFPAIDGKFYLERDFDHTLSRYTTEGVPDRTFPVLSLNRDLDVLTQDDGKVLIYDRYSDDVGVTVGGKRVPWFFRLNTNGTIDTTFTALTQLSGLRRTLYQYFLQPDGKIVGIAGNINRSSTNSLFRLNQDGSEDVTFSRGKGPSKGDSQSGNGLVSSLAFHSNGKILIAGRFKEFNGRTANSIVRLNMDGTIDDSFAIGRGFEGWPGANPNGFASDVSFTAIPDRGILVFGSFLRFNGNTATSPIWLTFDGSPVDFEFPAETIAGIATAPEGVVYYAKYPPGLGGQVSLNRIQLPDLTQNLPFRVLSILRESDSTKLTVETTTNFRYTIQGSSDLQTWIDLSSKVASGPILEFTDSTKSNVRYYRVHQTP